MSLHLPNLFLIGAPKSGTTTLHNWLNKHPEIFMSQNKEPCFFCEYGNINWEGPGSERFRNGIVTDWEDYLSLFSTVDKEKIVGESTTDYLWSEYAAINIKREIAEKYKNETKILIILRDPVKRAFSEHCHLIRENREKFSFIDSFKLENERIKNNWQPLFYHYSRGVYYEAIKRYFSLFGKENVHIHLYDDLNSDPNGLLDRVCDQLDINHIRCADEYNYNISGKPKNKFINNTIRSDNRLKKVISKFLPPKIKSKIKAIIDKSNLEKIHISEEEEKFAYNQFKDDIDKTEDLINRDLSNWKSNYQ